MTPIILLLILNRRHTMHSRRPLELNPLVRASPVTRLFLEDTLGRASVGVCIGLQRGEALCTSASSRSRTRAGDRGGRDWSAGGSAGGFEGEGGAGVLGGGDAQGELWFCGAGGVHFVACYLFD